MLTAVVGPDRSKLNRALMRVAVDRLPAILVDCAKSGDPHRYYPELDVLQMQRIYVFELDMLHKFRDILRHMPLYVRKLNAQIIVVTTSDDLLNYHNDWENRDVFIHTWQLMKKIGYSHDIVAGVLRDDV